MRHNPKSGAAPDVFLIPPRRRVVHSDHASDLVYLFADAGSEHLARAGHQGTLGAVHVQELLREKRQDQIGLVKFAYHFTTIMLKVQRRGRVFILIASPLGASKSNTLDL